MEININSLLQGFSRIRQSALLGYSHENNRNLYKTFGYDQEIEVQKLDAMYRRNDIANRIVSAFPQATWECDAVIEDESGDSEETSDFVKSAQDFLKENNTFHYLERLDRLSGIGQFAILVLGFNDGNNLSDELPQGNYDLLYIQPYKETSVEITKYVDDPFDPRFGLPEIYTVNPHNDSGTRRTTKRSSFNVHYSKVIHVSEFLDEDDVFGIPRLMPIYNRLLDLEKVVGGSSEMFWQNGRGGFVMSADKDANFSDEDKEKMKEHATEYEHELRRMMIGKGISVTPISIAVPDPKLNVDVLLDLISGTVGIPKRILTGSERGELASSQDENNFASRVQERRKTFAAPLVLKPFIQKMIDTGNIAQPNGYFDVYWERETGLNEMQKADIALKKAQTVSTYSNSSSSDIMPVGEFREKVLGLDPEIDYEAYPDQFEEDEIFDVETEDSENDTEGEDQDFDNEGRKALDEIEEKEDDDEELFQNFKNLTFMKDQSSYDMRM